MLDGSYATRWSALGKGSWLIADLGAVQTIGSIQVGWYLGASRVTTFELASSADGVTYTSRFSGASSGRSTRAERYSFPAIAVRFVRLTVMGNTMNDWASVTEFRVTAASAGGGSGGGTAGTGGGTAGTGGGSSGSGGGTAGTGGGSAGTGGGSAGTGGGSAGTGGGSGGAGGGSTGAGGGSGGGSTGTGGGSAGASAYETAVLADSPVALWAMTTPASGHETDLTGKGNTGTYRGTPSLTSMPNGGKAATFDGASQYLTVPSNATFSVPTTGRLTWEVWIRPDVLQFPNDTSDGYVDYMGKCADYGPTCEWESRMYGASTAEGRPSRLSAYIFNSSAGLGSAADWQPNSGVIVAGQWHHVVGEYQVMSQPQGCSGAQVGGIDIWVDGVKWSMPDHAPTGCMSQYSVVPRANNSPLNIGTMALDSWFKGAIGEVAIYNYLLTPAQIKAHFTEMTGKTPAGSCANACSL